MGAVYKKKLRSCAMCKPHKMAKAKTNDGQKNKLTRQEQRLALKNDIH